MAACTSWLAIEPSCSLNDEWTCIAIEYADPPLGLTALAADRSPSLGTCPSAAAAATAAVPCMKCRLVSPGPAEVTGLFAAWSSHMGYHSRVRARRARKRRPLGEPRLIKY